MNYQQYYENQQNGSGLPAFKGRRLQKGYGLGNMFKSFYRWIAPIIKTHAAPLLKDGVQTVGAEAAKTIANIANDAIDGKKVSESVKNHSKVAINNIANKVQSKIQKGQGYKRKHKSCLNKLVEKQKKKRSRQDLVNLL